MAFVPVPTTAKVEMIFSYNGLFCENVYHVEKATNYSESDLITLAQAFISWWNTNIKTFVPDDCVLYNVICTALDSDTSPAIEYSIGLPSAGSATSSAPLPNNVTVCIRWLTGYRGRSYRGRTFHIGLVEASVNGNEIEGSTLTQLVEGYNQLIDDMQDLEANLGVVSYVENKIPRTTGVFTPITSATVDVFVDSQRRRLPGRGA